MANFDTPEDTPTSRDWNWHPDVPITIGPLFHWPPRPRIILAWLARSWLTFGTTTILLALTLIVWFFFQPVIKRCATLELDWIAQIWLRNLVLALGFISSLHLYFHIFRKEGIHHKFEKRELARKNPDIFVRQPSLGQYVLDARQRGRILDGVGGSLLVGPGQRPCARHELLGQSGMVLCHVPDRGGVEFRTLLFCPPLDALPENLSDCARPASPQYQCRAVVGISMHPLEHLPYFSTIAIHFVLASHPIHVIFHMLIQG